MDYSKKVLQHLRRGKQQVNFSKSVFGDGIGEATPMQLVVLQCQRKRVLRRTYTTKHCCEHFQYSVSQPKDITKEYCN